MLLNDHLFLISGFALMGSYYKLLKELSFSLLGVVRKYPKDIISSDLNSKELF